MQGKKPGGSSGGGRSGELQGDEAQRNKKKKKKVSCFSNIKIFLVSECALMLAQGTVGAYLVSPGANSAADPLPCRRFSGLPPGTGKGPRRLRGQAGMTSARHGGWRLVQRRPPGELPAGARSGRDRGCRQLARRAGAREGVPERRCRRQVGMKLFLLPS